MIWKKLFGRLESPKGVEEEYDFPDFDLEGCSTYPTDGVVLDVYDEEIRMLFFLEKPGYYLEYKGVVELRMSRTRFLEIVRNINEKAKGLRGKVENLNYT